MCPANVCRHSRKIRGKSTGFPIFWVAPSPSMLVSRAWGTGDVERAVNFSDAPHAYSQNKDQKRPF